ncbi:hypothetical protein FHX74_000013 [Friedmanniella endophytica]|uniref:DUF3151 domain-containing protein n=1 Tax=Microlunatus kandeliicorticis TaxID=1759536 RepID=A0A7W3P404_9ACTN|nr:DUF3151 domain-containing protein [Microlunatus kandeliicorticis]MBA8792419.1 hypothetical protein [Microlunatus kandeliicorticis]
MTTPPHRDLLAPALPETRLPVDPAAEALADPDALADTVAAQPTSSLGWALLAERALTGTGREADLAGYAYARTGYHRGLDALRRAGWRGAGPVPWEHEPNRGFLRALWALATAARRIGEDDEYERCAQFLHDSSPTGYTALAGRPR